MQEKEEKTDREQVMDMIRMRKKEGDRLAKLIIVEFKSEYDKWTVLANKSDLREKNVYEKFFRAGCVKRGTGEASGKSSGTESRMGGKRVEKRN